MSAYDWLLRIELLKEYIEYLKKSHSEVSCYNQEFGEGSPEARILLMIKEEYEEELATLLEKLKTIKV